MYKGNIDWRLPVFTPLESSWREKAAAFYTALEKISEYVDVPFTDCLIVFSYNGGGPNSILKPTPIPFAFERSGNLPSVRKSKSSDKVSSFASRLWAYC